jgi:phosphoribosylformylglycinamidine synthase
MRNASLRFVCRDVWLRIETAGPPFTGRYARGQIIRCPVAHGEGNYRCDDETLARLRGDDRVAFRYVDANGEPTDEGNANGSMRNIAGIINEAGNVLGLMPHPERSVEMLLGSIDGLGVFRSLADSLAGAGPAGIESWREGRGGVATAGEG